MNNCDSDEQGRAAFELVFHHAIMMHYPAFVAEQKHYAACKPQKITIVIMIYYYAPSGVANRYSEIVH